MPNHEMTDSWIRTKVVAEAIDREDYNFVELKGNLFAHIIMYVAK